MRETVGVLITNITEQTIGIGISAHLFRTADATTPAEARGDMPHLASALLGHKHPRVTEEHYNRASSLGAADKFADVIQTIRTTERDCATQAWWIVPSRGTSVYAHACPLEVPH